MDANKCGREIALPWFGTSVLCNRGRGHPDNCSGPLYTPSGEYVGELEDGCTQPPTATITFVTRGRAFDWTEG